jgi:hypothetical protein
MKACAKVVVMPNEFLPPALDEGYVIIFTLRPLKTQRKTPSYLVNRRVGGSREQIRSFSEEKSLLYSSNY